MNQSSKDIRPIIKALKSKNGPSLLHIIEALELLAMHIDNDFILLEKLIKAKKKTWWECLCERMKLKRQLLKSALKKK